MIDMRLNAFAAALFALSIIPQGLAACPGENEAVVQNGYFHFGYSSWRRATDPNEDSFIYGRCVRTLNYRWLDVTWEIAGLSGTVQRNNPLSSEYFFVSDLPILATGMLQYGRGSLLEHSLEASFWQNHAESHLPFAMNAVAVQELQYRLQEGDTVPESVTSIRSEANVNFQYEDSIFSLSFSISSDLPGSSTFSYLVRYKLSLVEPEDSEVGVPDNIRLVPISPAMFEIIGTSLSQESIPIDEQEGALAMFAFGFQGANRIVSANIYRDVFTVLVNDEALATFPVTFYGPDG